MIINTDREAAAARVFTEHRDAIHRFLSSMTRDPAEAEDLTQETLLRAHTKLATLDDESRIVPWLYRIATNIARDRFRQASWRHRPDPLDSEESGPALPVTDPAPRLDKVMEQREMSDCVRRYLEDLAASYQTVILLHDVQGLTNPEVADLLGISVDAVKIRLHRARAKLRAALATGCSFSQDERGVSVCEPRSDPEEDPGAGDRLV